MPDSNKNQLDRGALNFNGDLPWSETFLQDCDSSRLCAALQSLKDSIDQEEQRPSSRKLRAAVDAWCSAALPACLKDGTEFTQLAQIMRIFGSMGVRPTSEFQNYWNNAITFQIREGGVPGSESIVAALHGCAQLRISPPQELIDNCLNNYSEIFETEEKKQQYGGLFLQDLAMIHANNPTVFDKLEVALAHLFLSPKNHDTLNPASREQHYIAASYFQSDSLASILYATLEPRSLTTSMLQSRFAEIMRERIKSMKLTGAKSIHLSEEQVLPCLGSNVDLCLTVTGHDNRESKLWIQVDGPHHYLVDVTGDLLLDGSSHMQNVIAEREGHHMKRVSYQDLLGKNSDDYLASYLILRAINSHAAQENASTQSVTTQQEGRGKRPRISVQPSFSTVSNLHPPPTTPGSSFQR